MPAEEPVNQHIVIVTGAAPLDPEVTAQLPPDALVVAVDGGLDHALAAGLHPRHLVGDLDSVSDDGLAWAARNASIDRHPTDKDSTDTELALALAATLDPQRITLVGGGDRLDHTLAGIGSLGSLAVTSVPELDAWWSGQHITVVQGPGSVVLRLVPGSTLSLLALHGACTRVVLRNARWELDGVDLPALVGWGVSNEVPQAAGPVDVEVGLSSGVLTVFDVPAPVEIVPARDGGDAPADS
jgi:thiamine pyrophosphokinase